MSKENVAKHQKITSKIAALAQVVKDTCISAAIDGGNVIACPRARVDSMLAAADRNLMLDGLDLKAKEHALSACQSAIENYTNTHGHLPSDEMLASSLHAVNKLIGRHTENGIMLESVGGGMSLNPETTPIRNRTISIIFPTNLNTSTNDMVTMIPADANQAELFTFERVAVVPFGAYGVGDVIDESSSGQYGNMKQIHRLVASQQPDGTKTQYVFTSATDTKHLKLLPIKPFTASIAVNHLVVARQVMGHSGSEVLAINGSGVSATVGNGVITVRSTAPLKSTDIIDVHFEVDIVKAQDMIPQVDLIASSVVITPNQAVISTDVNVQAYFTAQREFGIDMNSQQMALARNMLSHDKDLKNLELALYAAMSQPLETFSLAIAANHTWKDEYQRFIETVSAISSDMLTETKTSGVVGMYCGKAVVNMLKAMGAAVGAGFFELAPNYVEKPTVHYVGKFAGVYKVFSVPFGYKALDGVELGPMDALLYGRGQSYGEAGIVNGDAVAPTMLPQGYNKFNEGNIIWTLRYQDLHPKGGEKYFRKLTLTQ